MNERRINELLDMADAGVAAPCVAGSDLAEQAIRRAKRRTTFRRTGLAVLAIDAVAAVMVVAIIFVFDTPTGSSESIPSPVATIASDTDSDIQQELANLRAKIAMQEAVIEALLAKEQQVDVLILHTVNPMDEVNKQVDRAAKQMVMTANRIELDRGQNDLSVRLYSDVLANFPDSVWAGIARKRIDEQEPPIKPRSAVTCDKSIT